MDSNKSNTKSKKVRILALNGGGVRGLFTISVLAELENVIEQKTGQTDVRIGNYFDLITGASIGGILALGLAEGKSARELKEVFFTESSKIFPIHSFADGARKFFRKIIAPTYKSDPLRKAIVAMIGDEITFNDLARRVMIPSINLSTGKPQFFKTPHNPDFTRDGTIRLIDAAMATSAAPTYFAPHYIEDLGFRFIDGGLVANNPSFIALHEVFGDMKLDFPHADYEDIHILNIGTMGDEYAVSPNLLSSKSFWKGGYLGLWGMGERLVLSTMAANQILHQNMLERELAIYNASGNYIKLDSKVPNEAASDITLDNSSPSSLADLAGRGKQLVSEEYAKNGALRDFFNEPAELFKPLVTSVDRPYSEKKI
ncbi:CBASS cGAMP-activated phospholipase [Pseudoalteromonas fuliginea]|uniref:CBASS cGAMP-activated phospholipase n=1 Tax=Pseudoalteromonas fuliginea TaxID=1872678 RepID=UPI0031812D42